MASCIIRGQKEILSLLALEFTVAHAFRWSISSGDDYLSFDVEVLVGIDVPRLDYPAIAGIDERAFRAASRISGQVVDAEGQFLSTDFSGSAFRIDPGLNKCNLLKVGSVIARRL